MEFNEDHIRILKKNRCYYDTLKASGALTKCSTVTIAEFQKVYFEAIAQKEFPLWCSACIVELIELVYLNYDKFLLNDTTRQARPEPSGNTPRLSTFESEGKSVPNPRRPSGKNR